MLTSRRKVLGSPKDAEGIDQLSKYCKGCQSWLWSSWCLAPPCTCSAALWVGCHILFLKIVSPAYNYTITIVAKKVYLSVRKSCTHCIYCVRTLFSFLVHKLCIFAAILNFVVIEAISEAWKLDLRPAAGNQAGRKRSKPIGRKYISLKCYLMCELW